MPHLPIQTSRAWIEQCLVVPSQRRTKSLNVDPFCSSLLQQTVSFHLNCRGHHNLQETTENRPFLNSPDSLFRVFTFKKNLYQALIYIPYTTLKPLKSDLKFFFKCEYLLVNTNSVQFVLIQKCQCSLIPPGKPTVLQAKRRTSTVLLQWMSTSRWCQYAEKTLTL